MQSNLDLYNQYSFIEGPLKTRKIQIYHGANYFSGGPVVLFRLDLGDYDEVFGNQIEGFYESLINLLPSFYEHHCSVGKPGGFLQRLKEGTLLGHVSEHIAIFLNINENHLGENDIRFIEDLAYAKSVVAEQVYDEGFTILNADEPLVLEVINRLYSKIILFGKSHVNIELKKHLENKGIAIYIKENSIIVNQNHEENRIVSLSEIPLFTNGTSKQMIDPLLAAVATLFSFKIEQDSIKKYLIEYVP